MKNLDLKTITIILLVSIIGLYSIFSPKPPKPGNGTVTIDGITYSVLSHKVDTFLVPHDSLIYKPGKTIKKDTTIYVEVPAKVDTGAILRNYFAINVYSDSILLKDSLGRVSITDSITQNNIKNRKWSYHINTKTIKDVTIAKTPPTTQLYIGADLGMDKVHIINQVSAGFILKTKSDRLYQLNGGLDNNLTPFILIGTYWKIKVK